MKSNSCIVNNDTGQPWGKCVELQQLGWASVNNDPIMCDNTTNHSCCLIPIIIIVCAVFNKLSMRFYTNLTTQYETSLHLEAFPSNEGYVHTIDAIGCVPRADFVNFIRRDIWCEDKTKTCDTRVFFTNQYLDPRGDTNVAWPYSATELCYVTQKKR